MQYKIVADSSANLLSEADLASVPLKIVTDQAEYVDDANLDIAAMLSDLAAYKGRSGTSCPNVADWLEAFGDAEHVFVSTITSGLSGSFNAALQAKQEYEEAHPQRHVCCLDSLSTGPEMVLTVEKLRHLIAQQLPFDQVEAEIRAYMGTTHLIFMLESLDNLSKNGRVSPLVAKAAGLLGIRVVGKASDVGTLQPTSKPRGEKKALETMLRDMLELGYSGGKVRIAHCFNDSAADALRKAIIAQFPAADVTVIPCRGLCSFYAEQGGLLVGFEGSQK